jgi:hypothetical protein
MQRSLPSHEPLSEQASAAVNLSLLAARVAAAARRAGQGEQLDKTDKKILDDALRAIRGVTQAIEFEESGGQRGSPLHNFSAVGYTVDAVSRGVPSTESEQIVRVLNDIAARVSRLRDNPPHSPEASKVAAFFSSLSDLSVQHAGTVGEALATL